MNCIFLRRGYGEINKAPNYSDNFADNDWATIAAVCEAGLVPTTWKVGDQKAMTINGTSYPIDIIGIQHDDYSDGSGKAPFTFQMRNSYNTAYTMNSSNTNNGGWTSCVMRTTHLPAILALMPSEVKAAIREVNKLTAGSSGSSINTTVDKLFLLSEIEVFGSTTYSKSGEGSQYAYYKEGNSKKKTLNGSEYSWWERSPYSSGSTTFCSVHRLGTVNYSDADFSTGVAFAFCF